jgi:hypothetical protein
VHATDLDGDGDVDAVASCFNGGTVWTFVNDGLGALTFQQALNVDRSGSYAWGHDLDGDGDLDLSVVDELTDSLYVFYNGDPPAVSTPDISPPQTPGARLAARPNPAYAIRGFDLLVEGLSGHVEIDLITVGGRRVRRLYEGVLPGSGVIPWRDSGALPAGTYVISARDGRRQASGTVQLLR